MEKGHKRNIGNAIRSFWRVGYHENIVALITNNAANMIAAVRLLN